MKRKMALIAFGGNALLPDNDHGLQEDQMANARKAAELMVHVVKKGYELIIVHGNGPQVGNLLIQMEEAADRIPPYTLDVCDAMTEGSMGFMLEKSHHQRAAAEVPGQGSRLGRHPGRRGPGRPGLRRSRPSRSGPFYSRERARALIAGRRSGR